MRVSISRERTRHQCDQRDYRRLPLLRISPEFKESYNHSLGELKIGEVLPKLKGSFSRKDDGEIISDIDNNSRMEFNPDVPREIYAMLNSLDTNPASKFHFLYLGCGWYQGFQIPWTIDTDGGCDFDLQKADEWLENLHSQRMISQSLYEKIHSILNAETLRIRDLIEIRGLVKDVAEIKWRKEWIEQGYVDHEEPSGEVVRYDLLDLMKTNNAILEFAFHYQGPYYVSVTTSVYEKSISAFKTMWEYYSQDYYKMLKGIKWDIYPDRLARDFKSAMESCAPYVSVSYQIQLLKDMRRFTDLNVTAMWRDVIRPSLHMLTNKDMPPDPPSDNKLSKYENWLKKMTNHITEKCYPSSQYTRYIQKNKVDRRIAIEKSLVRMNSAAKGTTREELIRRRNSGNDCPFFGMHVQDLNTLADLAKRSRIPLDTLVKCYDSESARLGVSVRELIRETIVPSGIHLQIPQGKTIVIFHGPPDEKKEAGRLRYTDENMRLAQRIVMSFGHHRSVLGAHQVPDALSPRRISAYNLRLFTIVPEVIQPIVDEIENHTCKNAQYSAAFHNYDVLSLERSLKRLAAAKALNDELSEAAEALNDELSEVNAQILHTPPGSPERSRLEARAAEVQMRQQQVREDVSAAQPSIEDTAIPEYALEITRSLLERLTGVTTLFIHHELPRDFLGQLIDAFEQINRSMIVSTPHGTEPTAETGFGSVPNKCLRFWLVSLYRYIGLEVDADTSETEADRIREALDTAIEEIKNLNKIQEHLVGKRDAWEITRVNREMSHPRSNVSGRDAELRRVMIEMKMPGHAHQKDIQSMDPLEVLGDPADKEHHEQLRESERRLQEQMRVAPEAYREEIESLLTNPVIKASDFRNREPFEIKRCISDTRARMTRQRELVVDALEVLEAGIRISVCLSLPRSSRTGITNTRQQVTFKYFPEKETARSIAGELLNFWCIRQGIQLPRETYAAYIQTLEKDIGDAIRMPPPPPPKSKH